MTDREATQRFHALDILSAHCGETLTPQRVEQIAEEFYTRFTEHVFRPDIRLPTLAKPIDGPASFINQLFDSIVASDLVHGDWIGTYGKTVQTLSSRHGFLGLGVWWGNKQITIHRRHSAELFATVHVGQSETPPTFQQLAGAYAIQYPDDDPPIH